MMDTVGSILAGFRLATSCIGAMKWETPHQPAVIK
jgi:hypothetical protein